MGSELTGEGDPEWKGSGNHRIHLSQREAEVVAKEVSDQRLKHRWYGHTGDH